MKPRMISIWTSWPNTNSILHKGKNKSGI